MTTTVQMAGVIIGALVALITLGLQLDKRQEARAERRDHAMRETIKAVVRDEIQPIQHELRPNGGHTVRDRIDVGEAEMAAVKALVEQLAAAVEKIERRSVRNNDLLEVLADVRDRQVRGQPTRRRTDMPGDR